jgi:LmbE family N-acetylglucosaminyl deacetylase
LATQSTSFVPNVYVDITPYLETKLKIMSMYDGEIMEEPYPRSLSSIRALARVRGSRAGVMYAEAFQSLYEKR